jgi:hypothetical protein
VSKWKTKKNTFGWQRAEVLGALVNTVFLIALCFTIVVASLQRFIEIEEIKKPMLLLIVGALGLLINLVGLALFHRHGRYLHRYFSNPFFPIFHSEDIRLQRYLQQFEVKPTAGKNNGKIFSSLVAKSGYFLIFCPVDCQSTSMLSIWSTWSCCNWQILI